MLIAEAMTEIGSWLCCLGRGGLSANSKVENKYYLTGKHAAPLCSLTRRFNRCIEKTKSDTKKKKNKKKMKKESAVRVTNRN